MPPDEEDVAALLNSLSLSATHEGTSTTHQQELCNDQWSRSVYLKVFSLDKTVCFQSLQNTLLSIWRKFGSLSVSHVNDDIFMVVFETSEALNQLFNEGPWNYLHDFIILERIIPKFLCLDTSSIL